MCFIKGTQGKIGQVPLVFVLSKYEKLIQL